MIYTLSTIKEVLNTTNEIILDSMAYVDKMKDTITYNVEEREVDFNPMMSIEKSRTGNFLFIYDIMESFINDLGKLRQYLDDLTTPNVLLPDLSAKITKYSKEVDDIKSNFISYDFKLNSFITGKNYKETADSKNVHEYLEVMKEYTDRMVGIVDKATYLDRSVSEVDFNDTLSDVVIDYLIGRGQSPEVVENTKEQVLNVIKDLYSNISVLLSYNNTDVLSSQKICERLHMAIEVANQNLNTISDQ